MSPREFNGLWQLAANSRRGVRLLTPLPFRFIMLSRVDEGVQRPNLRGLGVGGLPVLGDLLQGVFGGLYFACACLGAGEPVAVADGGAAVEALAEQVFCVVVLLGADVGLEEGVLEDFALGVAATDAGELREYGSEVSRRVFVAVVGECADAFDEGQGYLFGEGVSLSGKVAQAILDAAEALFVTAGGECEGGVSVTERGTGRGRDAG